MLQAHSSRLRRVAFAAAGLIAIAACSHSGGTTAGASRGGEVGYVRMDDLVKLHPLYAQLTRLDDDMAALQLKNVGTAVAVSPADLERERLAMQRELDSATERAKAALKAKQDDYARRENEAIRQAIAAASGVSGGGGGAIQSGMQTQLQAQAKIVTAEAQKNFEAYRASLLRQDAAAIETLTSALNAEAGRTYRTQAEAYQKKEADFALQLASQDAGARLSLRAKLSNLVLDDAARADARKQLDVLDRKEADQLAALKNRDAGALATLRSELRDQTQRELQARAAEMRKRTLAKIEARDAETRREVVAKLSTLPGSQPPAGGAAGSTGLPPDMRAKLEALHKQYQDDFNRDAQQTLDAFAKTKAELAERFARLQGVDLNAEASANRQLGVLQKQRNDLYGQMVAQIGREVKLVAAQKGISVVFTDVVAPAGGVDLTADAGKDIESLHE